MDYSYVKFGNCIFQSFWFYRLKYVLAFLIL